MSTYGPIATHEINGNRINVYADNHAESPNTWGWGTVHRMPWICHKNNWLSEVHNTLSASGGSAKVFQINGDQVKEYDLWDVHIYPETEEEGQAYDAAFECDGYVIFNEEQTKAGGDLNILALDLFETYAKWAEGEVYWIENNETGESLSGLYIDPHDKHEVAQIAEENGLLLQPSRIAERILDEAEEEIARVIDNARLEIQALHQQK